MTRKWIVMCMWVLGACGSDDGAAPVIADLSLNPSDVPVATQTTINGSLNFDDPDGDLQTLDLSVSLPDDTVQKLGQTEIANVGDMTEGTINFQIFLNPPAQGQYTLRAAIIDAAGARSNEITAVVTAQ